MNSSEIEMNEEFKYILHITALNYCSSGEYKLSNKYIAIELDLKLSVKSIIVKANKNFNVAIIGINSTLPYFCQIYYVSLLTGIGSLMRPINWVNCSDSLEESNGRINMMINTIEWSKTESYILIMFDSGFFSIIDKSGCPLRIFRSTKNMFTKFAVMRKLKEILANRVIMEFDDVFYE